MLGRGTISSVTDQDPRQRFEARLREGSCGYAPYLRAYQQMNDALLDYLRKTGITIEPGELPAIPREEARASLMQWAVRLTWLQVLAKRKLDPDAYVRFATFGRTCAEKTQDQLVSDAEGELRALAAMCDVRQGDEMRLVSVWRQEEFPAEHYAHALAEITALDFVRQKVVVEVRERVAPRAFEVWAQCSALDTALVMHQRMPLCEFLVECAKRKVDPRVLSIPLSTAHLHVPPIELGVEIPFVPSKESHG